MTINKGDYEAQIQVQSEEIEILRKENAELKRGQLESTDVLKRLSAPLPAEAVQRADKGVTHKGYDTTGFGYQFIVNRFNEVLGTSWGYSYNILRDEEGKTRDGKTIYELTIRMEIWIINNDDRRNFRECVGGHISLVYVDALKGAITNAFKKTAAFWGVGKEAYEGSIDDDTFYPSETEEKTYNEPKTIPKETSVKKDTKSEPVAVGPGVKKDLYHDMTWTKFWVIVKNELGFNSKEAHSILGVFNMEEWIQQKRKLSEAIEILRERKDIKEDDDKILAGYLIGSED